MRLVTFSAVSLMRLKLRYRLMLLFVAVLFCALMAALTVRQLIVRDFRNYQDGESQDRVERIIAQLEGNFHEHNGWQTDAVARELAWALQLGFEAQLIDVSGLPVMDSAKALYTLAPLLRKRVLDTSGYVQQSSQKSYVTYPLFLKGEEIGIIELRPFNMVKEEFFIASANRFLMISMALLGFMALVISLIASASITRPVLELTKVSSGIAAGNHALRADISRNDEIGELALSFNHLAETIETEEKLRRRLLSGAAHELRTPLAIICGELEGMIDGILPKTEGALLSMQEEAKRLTSILDGIDELTRAEAASLKLELQNFKLKPFLEALVSRYKPLCDQKQGVLLLDCPDDLEIKADPDRLSQILINLLSNAIKAIPAAGKVSLAAYSQKDGAGIEITDNGHGILPEDLPYIFERFYKKGGNGLGIGLAIVKELVNAHGWNIAVSSCQGRTCFAVHTWRQDS